MHIEVGNATPESKNESSTGWA